jgi:hypothetical protein
MHSDWTVACAADDPEIVIPWSGKDPSLCFVDLRPSLDAVLQIPEAREYACIAAALQRWNQPDSWLFTAKCDVWSYPAKLFDAEDLPGFAYARGCYVDLLHRDVETFASFEACERQLRRWNEIAQSIDLPACRCEWTLRPARIFPDSAKPLASAPANNGFATTLYVWGYGNSQEAAANAWDEALRALIERVSTFSGSQKSINSSIS